jgi:hypothetical protein
MTKERVTIHQEHTPVRDTGGQTAAGITLVPAPSEDPRDPLVSVLSNDTLGVMPN